MFKMKKTYAYQNKCPHMLTTASLAVSKQILHSYDVSDELVLQFASLFDDESLLGLEISELMAFYAKRQNHIYKCN